MNGRQDWQEAARLCGVLSGERDSLDLTRFFPAAARSTDADSRIGTWLMFNKDHGANGLVSKSVE